MSFEFNLIKIYRCHHKYELIATEEYDYNNWRYKIKGRKLDTLKCKKCGILKSIWRGK